MEGGPANSLFPASKEAAKRCCRAVPGNLIVEILQSLPVKSYEEAVDRCCGVLPGDLILEILQRLPVKSLLRFESVSKAWLFLILNLKFIEEHLSHQKKKQMEKKTKVNHLHCYSHVPQCRNDIDNSMLAQVTSSCPRDHYKRGVSLISEVDNDQTNGPFSTRVLSHESDYRFSLVSVVGSSNGLVCIKLSYEREWGFHSNQYFGIWNPATRKLKVLPSPQRERFFINEPYDTTSVGFSYDPSTACYKLVQVSVTRANQVSYVTRVHVLNKGEDRRKEVLSHGLDKASHERPFHIFKSTVVVNGCLHWFGSIDPREESYGSLVRFDMEKEVFIRQRTVSYPFDDGLSFSNTICNLAVFEENLAMFVNPSPGSIFDEFTFDESDEDDFSQLWIYDGPNHTWKKRFTFGPLPTDHYPTGFLGDREIILKGNEVVSISGEQINTSNLIASLYNLYTKETTISPCREILCNLAFYPYVESLVQI